MRALRIAWVMPYLPAPETNGGRIRAAHLARALARDAELSLFARVAGQDEDFERERRGAAIAPFRETHAFAWPRRLHLDPREPTLVRGMPLDLGRRLAEEHARRRFDGVVIAQSYAAGGLSRRVLRALRDTPVVVDEHNVESAYYRRALADLRDGALGNLRQWLSMRRFERALWRRAAGVTTVTEGDAAIVREVTGAPVRVVPNGVALSSYRYIAPSARTSLGVLFVGMLSYEPNERAAVFLATEVLPRLQRLVPGAFLTLAGRDPTPRVLALASPSVRVPGTLPSVAPLFDEHGAYALPLSFGAGSSLKVLEPLAAGLPLVANAFGVRGFSLRPGVSYRGAETADEFAAALCSVLTDRVRHDALADAGRAEAARHDWALLGLDFSAFVRDTCASQRP